MKRVNLELSNFNEMIALFHEESDRGAAVLAAGYVDSVLRDYIECRLEDDSISDELFNANGPLSTFSQRIKIAHGFGLIPPNMAQRLDYIRKIRNHFAHHPLSASFDERPVVDWIGEIYKLIPLRENQKDIEFSTRETFMLGCGEFAGSCQLLINRRRDEQRNA